MKAEELRVLEADDLEADSGSVAGEEDNDDDLPGEASPAEYDVTTVNGARAAGDEAMRDRRFLDAVRAYGTAARLLRGERAA